MYGKINGIYYKKLINLNSDKNLVFVHGAGCNCKFLEPLAKELKDYNCYLISLPGHYKSDKKICNTVEEYSEEIIKFISNLNNVTLIGHSLGGVICLETASRNLPQVKNVISISSGAKFDKMDKKLIEQLSNGKVDMLYLMKALGSLTKLSTYKALLNMEPKPTLIKHLLFAPVIDIEDKLFKINIPTLLLAGEDETLILAEYSEKAHKLIKNSKLIIVPNVKHMLPIAKKKFVAEIISEFIYINSNNVSTQIHIRQA